MSVHPNLVTMEELALTFLKDIAVSARQAIAALIVRKKDLIAGMTHVQNVQCAKTSRDLTTTLACAEQDTLE